VSSRYYSIIDIDNFSLGTTYEVMSGKKDVNLDITPTLLNCFKYATITIVDVERSFSLYKHILNNRRFNFNENYLEIYLIINF